MPTSPLVTGQRVNLLKVEAVTQITDELEATVFASQTQAELAASAAGAPLYSAMPSPLTGVPTPFLLSTSAGVQVYTHDGTTATMQGWLGQPEFASPTIFFAFSGALGPVGTRLRAKTGEVWDVVAAGTGDFNHPVSGIGVNVVKGAALLPQAALYHDFSADADGMIASGTRLDSGHPVAIVGSVNNLPRVADGEMRFLDPSSPTTGTGYLYLNVGEPVREIGCRFVFHEGASAGNVLAVVIKGASGGTLEKLAHPIFYRDQWVMQVRPESDPMSLIQVGGGFYRSDLVDGREYDVAIRFDPDDNSVTIVDPFGDAHRVEDELIDATVCGQYAYWQVNTTDATADDFGIVRIHAKTDAQLLVGAGDACDPIRLAGAVGLTLSEFIAANPTDTLTFTPTSTGWWRVWTATGLNRFDGQITLYSDTGGNNLVGDVLDVGLAAFSGVSDMNLNARNYIAFNTAVSAVRIGNNASNTLYFDINVAVADKPITVTMSGAGVPSFPGLQLSEMTPAGGASAPTRSVELTMGSGLRTASSVVSRGAVVGLATVTATGTADTSAEVSVVDATSGNITLTMPTSSAGRRHTITRVDNSGNTVSVVAFFADGTTSKSLAYGASLTLIGTAYGSPVKWAIV